MIGDKIRMTRKAKGLTLKDLAEGAGVTASYISQLERNIIEPSISTLRKIASVLAVPLFSFLEDEGNEPILVKADKRQRLELPDSNIVYEYLTPMLSNASKLKMEIVYFEMDEKSWIGEEGLQHKSDECIFLIQGSLRIYLGDESYDLEEGDSIYIRENIPHRMYNGTNKKAIGISCISPANV